MKPRILFAALFLLAPFAATAQPLADRIPDDALIYIGWRGAADPGSGYSESRLKAFIDASALPQFFNESLPKLMEKFGQNDKQAAQFHEVMNKFVPVFWKYPTAMYIGPVDGLTVAQPTPRVALLCKAGPDAAKLKADINHYLDQLPPNIPLPITVVEEDGMVAVLLGNVTPDLAGKTKTTLPYRKEFTAAMEQVGKDPLLVVYADVEQLTALIDQVANVTPQIAPRWRVIRDTVGVGGLKRLAWTAGFDGRDFSTQGLIQAPAPRTGIMELLNAPPLSNDILKTVPKDATMLVAGKADFAKLLSMARTIGGQIDPNIPNAIAGGLAAGGVVIGMSIEEDLLKPLGDDWLLYTSPSTGGVGPLGFVIVNRARDAVKLERALGILEQFINGRINAETAAGKPRGNFVTTTIDGLKVHYFNTPFVTPAWTIKNGNLYMALYPQTCVAAANAPSGSSILDNAEFVAMRKRLGGEMADGKLTAVSFFDLPRTAPTGYPYLLAASHLAGVADMFGVPTPPMLLPGLDKIMPLLSPAGSVTWIDDMGAHVKSITPFPGANLLGGPEVILIEAQALIAPAVILPAVERQKAVKAAAAQQ